MWMRGWGLSALDTWAGGSWLCAWFWRGRALAKVRGELGTLRLAGEGSGLLGFGGKRAPTHRPKREEGLAVEPQGAQGPVANPLAPPGLCTGTLPSKERADGGCRFTCPLGQSPTATRHLPGPFFQPTPLSRGLGGTLGGPRPDGDLLTW